MFGEQQTQHTRAGGPLGALLQSGACAETGRDPESETAVGLHLKTYRGSERICVESRQREESMRPCVNPTFGGSRPAGIRGIPASFYVVSKQ